MLAAVLLFVCFGCSFFVVCIIRAGTGLSFGRAGLVAVIVSFVSSTSAFLWSLFLFFFFRLGSDFFGGQLVFRDTGLLVENLVNKVLFGESLVVFYSKLFCDVLEFRQETLAQFFNIIHRIVCDLSSANSGV